ncbi:MAG: DUF2188 domain-containing protein, partial [Methanomassiliicoccaceae archaeon]|nr:DUF2188 domain-containing protein [Methanomassiliicoccaceae archaeon]
PNAKKGKDQYVRPHPDGGWQVVGEGNSKATVRTKTEEDAIRVAKEIAWNQGSKYIPYEEKKGLLKKKK